MEALVDDHQSFENGWLLFSDRKWISWPKILMGKKLNQVISASLF
jgi:hypothetical protein